MEPTGRMESLPVVHPVSIGVRAVWAVAIIAIAALFVVGTVILATIGPSTRSVEYREMFDARLGAITAPVGWHVDIGSAVFSRPQLSREDVTVSTFTAVWMGSTDDLVPRVADWFTPDGAEATLPHEVGERVIITYSGEVDGQLVVLHSNFQVAIFTIQGPPDQIRAYSSDIDWIIDSIRFYDEAPLDVDR